MRLHLAALLGGKPAGLVRRTEAQSLRVLLATRLDASYPQARTRPEQPARPR